MTDFHLIHFLSLCLLVVFSWVLPKKWQMGGVSLVGNLFLLLVSPISFFSLFLSSSIVYLVAIYKINRWKWVLFAILYCAIQFILLRELQSLFNSNQAFAFSLIGIAYFTCRNIHFLFESFKKSFSTNLKYFWYYQSFLPVMMTGPINRYPDFVREMERRHYNPQNISSALERIIYGYAKIVIVGNYLIQQKLSALLNSYEQNTLAFEFLQSAIDWMYLYVQFSGWSDIAIGFSLLIGVKINENFNHPYKALNIIDFWQRWHISLSLWCRDYIYIPVLAATRNPFYAIVAAMIAMGLWHELSTYYVLWAIYHACGIAVCRLFQNLRGSPILAIRSHRLWPVLSWVITMMFIVSGSLIVSHTNDWLLFYA